MVHTMRAKWVSGERCPDQRAQECARHGMPFHNSIITVSVVAWCRLYNIYIWVPWSAHAQTNITSAIFQFPISHYRLVLRLLYKTVRDERWATCRQFTLHAHTMPMSRTHEAHTHTHRGRQRGSHSSYARHARPANKTNNDIVNTCSIWYYINIFKYMLYMYTMTALQYMPCWVYLRSPIIQFAIQKFTVVRSPLVPAQFRRI